jgi:U3 small nucleolar RNA-associated protein 22
MDIAVVIPETCLFKKAHLDYRYHARRALYLAHIAAQLSGQSPSATAAGAGAQQQQKKKAKVETAPSTAATFAGRSLALHALQHDPSRPVLVIPGALQAGTQQPSYLLRLIPVVPSSAFPFARLNPDRNGVRWVVSDSKKGTAGAASGTLNPRDDPVARSSGTASTSAPSASQPAKGGQGGQQQPPADVGTTPQPRPTPQYNAGVLSDMTALLHALLLHRTFSDLPHLSDALLLLKVSKPHQGPCCLSHLQPLHEWVPEGLAC